MVGNSTWHGQARNVPAHSRNEQNTGLSSVTRTAREELCGQIHGGRAGRDIQNQGQKLCLALPWD